jgi:hypothetical protein
MDKKNRSVYEIKRIIDYCIKKQSEADFEIPKLIPLKELTLPNSGGASRGWLNRRGKRNEKD